MKKALLVTGLLMVSLLIIGVAGCAEPAPEPMPPLNPPGQGAIIEITCDEFTNQQHITRTAELTHPGSLIVILCANPSTGFEWVEEADISNDDVVSQVEHNFVPPQPEGTTPAPVGAPGKDVWTFDSLKQGTSTISLEYSRPWEGGEKGEWTFTVEVTVK